MRVKIERLIDLAVVMVGFLIVHFASDIRVARLVVVAGLTYYFLTTDRPGGDESWRP